MSTIKKLAQSETDKAFAIYGGIHEITAKVTVNKAKMADKAMNAITQYISS